MPTFFTGSVAQSRAAESRIWRRLRSSPHWVMRTAALAYAWAPALLIMAVIFRLSRQSDFGGPHWLSTLLLQWLGSTPPSPGLQTLLDLIDRYNSWVAHFVEFGALAVALLWGIRHWRPALSQPHLAAWVLTLLYALSDELHQAFVPGRHPDPRDIVTDGVGALLALLVINWLVPAKEQGPHTEHPPRTQRA